MNHYVVVLPNDLSLKKVFMQKVTVKGYSSPKSVGTVEFIMLPNGAAGWWWRMVPLMGEWFNRLAVELNS